MSPTKKICKEDRTVVNVSKLTEIQVTATNLMTRYQDEGMDPHDAKIKVWSELMDEAIAKVGG